MPRLPIAALCLHGPLVAILLGAAWPGGGAGAKLLLLPAVGLLIALAVAGADAGPPRGREVAAALALAGCNLLLCPLVAFLVAGQLGVASPGRVALLAAGPAAGSAALVAGLLGLPSRPLLLAQLLCFLLLPLSLPLVAMLLGEAMRMGPGALMGRVLLVAVLPAAAGLAARRLAGAGACRCAAAGLAGAAALWTIGLAVGGELAAGASLLAALPTALAVCLLGGALGAAAGLGGGGPLVLAMALGGAVRNFSLVWSATAGLVSPEMERLMAAATLCTLLLPPVLAVLRHRAAPRRMHA